MKNDEIVFETDSLPESKTNNQLLMPIMAKIKSLRWYIIIVVALIILSCVGYYIYDFCYRASAPVYYYNDYKGRLIRIVKDSKPETLLSDEYTISDIILSPNTKDAYILADVRQYDSMEEKSYIFYVNSNIKPKLLIKSDNPDITYEISYKNNFVIEKNRMSNSTNVYTINKDKIKPLFQNLKNVVYSDNGKRVVFVDSNNSLFRYINDQKSKIADDVKKLNATDGNAGSFIGINNQLYRFRGDEVIKIDDNVVEVYSTEDEPAYLYYTVNRDGQFAFYLSVPGRENKLITDKAVTSPCLISDNKGVVFKDSENVLYYYNENVLDVIASDCLDYKMIKYESNYKMKNYEPKPESNDLKLFYLLKNGLYYYSSIKDWQLLDYSYKNPVELPYMLDSSSNIFYYISDGCLYSHNLEYSSSDSELIASDVSGFLVHENTYYGYLSNDKIYCYLNDGSYTSINGTDGYPTIIAFREGIIVYIRLADNLNGDNLYYIVKGQKPELVSSNVRMIYESGYENKIDSFTYSKRHLDNYDKTEIYKTNLDETYRID